MPDVVARAVLIGFLVLCTAETTLFVILFAFRSRWRSTSVGRSTLYLWIGFAAIFWLAMTRLVFGLPEWLRVYLGVGIYASLTCLFGWKLWILIQIQRNPEAVELRDAERELAREVHQAEKENPS